MPGTDSSLRWLALSAALLAGVSLEAMALSCLPFQSSYQVRGDKIAFYINDRRRAPAPREVVVEAADPGTFKALPYPETGPCAGLMVDYGKDRKHVFYEWRIVEGADPESFVLLPHGYARDKAAIYSRTKRLTTRAKDFSVTANSPYATDGEIYFYHDNIIDEPGFRSLGGYGYARTNTRVYRHGRVLPGADVETFETSATSLRITRDKNFVYYEDEVIPNADPRTFAQLRGYTFFDKRAVYVEGKEVAGADPRTARLSEFGSYVIDSNAVYRHGKTIAGRDPATFAELQHPWTKDRNGVYYEDAPFDVDLATFRATALQRGEDKNFRFDGRHKYCKFNAADPARISVCK